MAMESVTEYPRVEGNLGLALKMADRLKTVQGFVRYAVVFFFSLYAVALTCSMAAMEILSWTTVLFVIIYLVLELFIKSPDFKFVKTGYGPIILGFIAISSLGVFINAPRENWVKDLGALRDFLLFFFFFYAFRIYGDIRKFFYIMLGCGTIIAVYGIWQHYTGIDLWRHDHRALVPIFWGKEQQYSTVGFFNHHLTYAYSFGMLMCLPLALLLTEKKIKFWVAALPLASLMLIGLSIVFTYGRGAWLAMALTVPSLVFLARRKYFFAVVGLLIASTIVGYSTNLEFRQRLDTVVRSDYYSNRDREDLWKANLEMFKDHPIIGVGYLENEPLSTPYYARMGIKDGMAGHAHNNYIEFLSTGGLLGFLAYLFLVLTPLTLSFRVFFFLENRDESDARWDKFLILAAIGAQLMFHLGGLTQCTVCDSKVLHQFVVWLTLIFVLASKYNLRLFRRS